MRGQISRRTAIAAGGGSLGAALLAACGSDGSGSSGTDGDAEPSGQGQKSQGQKSQGRKSQGQPLAKVADVPVGGAVRIDSGGDPIALAQPQEGTVVAFSAVCTHQGCTVGADGDRLVCPCHGSVYEAATGKVLDGPAPRALPSVPVEVDGDNVVAS